MDEGISSGKRDPIGLAVFPEDCQVSFDLVEGLVSLGVVFAVAPLTVQIAGLRDLEPGDGIVGQVPWEPVVPVVVEKERHENSLPGITLSGISILDFPIPFSISQTAILWFCGPARCIISSGRGLRPRKAGLSPCRQSPRPRHAGRGWPRFAARKKRPCSVC